MCASGRVTVGATEVLDLSYLATGYRQHAFVRTGAEADGFVYKIPAAFGYVLPYRHRLSPAPRRITSPKAALYWALLVAPHRFRTGVFPAFLRRLPATVLALTRPLGAAGGVAAAVARQARNRLLMAHSRRARARDFAVMLDTLDDLDRHGLRDLVVPYRIMRRAVAILRVDGEAIPYTGPMLAQQHVDTFVTKQALAVFDWDELVASLHALWRHGFALTEKGENLGYRSWALMDGHVRLADTSSLTRDLGRARRSLRDENLDAQQRMVLTSHRDARTAEAFAEFFRYIRRHVSRAQLETLWRADTDRADAPAVTAGAIDDPAPVRHT